MLLVSYLRQPITHTANEIVVLVQIPSGSGEDFAEMVDVKEAQCNSE
jgi:hypothetical protein